MLIKIDIEPSLIKKIEELIENGNYSDLRQFITIAIANQLEEETSEQSEIAYDAKKYPELTKPIKPLSIMDEIRKATKEVQFNLNERLGMDWKNLVREMLIEKSEFNPEKNDLIWYFYNRFFPAKVVLYQLAKLMSKYNKSWIELAEVQEEAFDFAERVSTRLREHEFNNKIARNKKLSTGLPTPQFELTGLKGSQKRKKEEKLQKGKTRFMEQIVGKLIKSKNGPKFSGACFDLGLVGVKIMNNSCFVSLTEFGKTFTLLQNPILDDEKLDKAFYDEEIKFIIEKIYPQFKLENKIIYEIISMLKSGTVTAEDLDKIFKRENRKYITEERVATMGRLSELQLVIWEIDNEGKSIYNLNRDKLHLIN